MKDTDQIWVVVFHDGETMPADGFLFSNGPDAAMQHGGVKGIALVQKE